MASVSTAGLQFWLRPWANYLLTIARQRGYRVVVTSVRRSSFTQAILYRRFLAGLSPYPAAPPGTSMHEVGRAFDLGPDGPDVRALGAIWESWGGTYGAKFNDPIHFEA